MAVGGDGFQNPEEILAREGDAACAGPPILSGQMQEDGAARIRHWGGVVVADNDNKIIEVVVPPHHLMAC